jgi:sugar O-acyltransferase (sialic acid O-acetyltransferase NeuD family)
MKKIAIYGGGGFGKEVATVIQKINEQDSIWNLIGFFDDGLNEGSQISRYGRILGNMNRLNDWTEELAIVFAIGDPETLAKVQKKITNPKVWYPNIIHPEVYMADEVTLKIGQGNVIVRGCSFSVDVAIGDFNQFNSISALGHDVQVGSYNVFMPLSRISGGVQIGDYNFFGINAIVLQNVKIGICTKIGANSVVIRKTKDNNLYLGSPAKRMKL